MVGRYALRLTRPGAFLVNVGRGSVIDEEAVAEALEESRLGGYAADVFAMEDWALPGHPAEIPPKAAAPSQNPVHPASRLGGHRTRRAMSLTAARQVRQALGGQRPDHAVNDPLSRGGPASAR